MIGQKEQIIRSKKITDAARGRSCVNCMSNDGTVVRAHYSGMRQHQYGKGRGIKGHDCIAADLCQRCHAKFDSYQVATGETQLQRDIDHSEQFLHLCFLTLVRDIQEGVYKL